MMWTYGDAVMIAMDMLNAKEIKFDDLEAVTNELWKEMQEQNEKICD